MHFFFSNKCIVTISNNDHKGNEADLQKSPEKLPSLYGPRDSQQPLVQNMSTKDYSYWI